MRQRMNQPRAVCAAFGVALLGRALIAFQPADGQVRPSATAAAQAWSAAGKQADFVMKDFQFADGTVLPELRIHYTTLGAPHRNAAGVVTNAVLILHGTTGSGRGFMTPTFAGELF